MWGWFSSLFGGYYYYLVGLVGLGVIVSDWRGEAIGALSTSVPAAQTVVELEALACRRAVLFAVELGLQDVVFEGDSLQVI